ncbi:MAG: hypothetical protein IPK17_16535 [Chloroflexi bacterium]|uniref:hypothetical protein n=1 Tax=Candidatus Flexifilum breve TaxID=3140694 RepID=UPI003136F123|nr:hypothetical protein [Chloroflexota bacterium]
MSTFDVQPHLAAIAARTTAARQPTPMQMAYALNEGHPLAVFCADAGITLDWPGVLRVNDPEIANVSLIAHRGDARLTAQRVEACFTLGQRVALWDAQADPALIDALLNTIIYLGNLAALDTDLERTLAAVMTPLREGAVLRYYLADSLLRQWIWAQVVRPEVERLVGGDVIEPRQLLRAETQTRVRLGAWLTKVKRRGLPYEIQQIGFKGNRLDGFWVKLQAL